MQFEFSEARHNLGHGDSLDDVLPAGLGIAPLPAALAKKFDQRWATRGAYRSGHNTARDANYSAFVNVDREVPVSPVLVRDLAGRVIHIGLGPERKDLDAWSAYLNDQTENAAQEADERNIPAVVFPQGCEEVPDETPWLEGIEQVFMTKFRTLDMGFEARTALSTTAVLDEQGEEDEDAVEVHAGTYEAANLYPYKLRPDTFYQDGWRLPQVQMVYARPADVQAAWRAGEALRAAWRNRAAGENYAAFIARQGGATWQDKLFAEGCTLMPTFEACNGFAVVGRAFEIEDYWPGRAVVGLHEVKEERPDQAPPRTILEVLEPGYVTAGMIVPAVVVVSDGSGYVSPNSDDPLPLLPNLDLPHQRTAATWGTTWLPTHPAHFEPPMVWGWDEETGHFLQLGGPLWDPLHYYYASVDLLVQAYEQPAGATDHRWLVPVPAVMHTRFYPIVPLMGFDTLSVAEMERRKAARILPVSAVKQIRDDKVRAGIGYHPLPVEFEYELEPFWAPELHPARRDAGPCPEEWVERLVGVIKPQVTPAEYLTTVDAPAEATWLLVPAALAEPQGVPLKDYPFLARYMLPDLPPDDVLELAEAPYLADVGEAWLTLTASELWPGVDSPVDLEALLPGLAIMTWGQREDGLTQLRFRHLVYRQNPALYTLCWWFGMNPGEMAEMFANTTQAMLGRTVPTGEETPVAVREDKAAMAPGTTPVALVPGESVPR